MLVAACAASAACADPATTAGAAATAGSADAEGFRLVWSQEFDADGPPDPAVWVPEVGFARNEEAQWYQADNAAVRDGLLVIEARRERVDNPGHVSGSRRWQTARTHAEITSASLTTRGTATWLYGRFVMRARIDIRPGLWPAWWTLGDARPWPGCGEIDIMEYYAGNVLANACWQSAAGRWGQHWDSVRVPVATLAEDTHADADAWAREFHVWQMDWTEDEIRLSLDGKVLNVTDVRKTVNPDGSNPFREPHSMLVNLAVGGVNGGPFDQTQFPARFEVDYIRVYQREPQKAE